MANQWWVPAYRAAFALLTLVAMATQFVHEWNRGGSIANFFSFFTIEGNLAAAAVLLWGATRDPERRDPATVDLIRGAATLYLIVVGVVYDLLLDGYQQELQTTIPWVNTVV